MAKFLSDEWFTRVEELTAEAGDLEMPAALESISINMVVTGEGEADEIKFAMSGGNIQRNHVEDAPTTLTMPSDVIKKVFLERDQAAAMQAFMSGQIKVDGDMGTLMGLQGAAPSPKGKELMGKINEMTEV